MYIGMVRAGESSGSLDSALDRIADHAQAAARLQARIRTAMTYPAIMAVVGTSIVAFLLAYVVPQVTRVFLEANQTLPLPTRALMGLGQGLARWGLEILLLTATAAFAARALWKSEKGHRRLEGMLYALPLLGGFCRDIETARFTHTLSTMVAGGMSIVDGLDVALSVCPKGLFADAIEETRNGVSEGASLASALERSGLFNPTAIDMIVVGERSGELESMLSKASQALEEEVREQIEAMASLLEPAMILLMAAVVLFVVLAILLPVFEMNQLVG
jgi:general secretion pathway protein F